jgi:hypothetical protein
MARIEAGVVVPRYRPSTGMRVDRFSSRVFVDHCHGIAVEWKKASLTEAPGRHHQPIPSPVTDYQTVSRSNHLALRYQIRARSQL